MRLLVLAIALALAAGLSSGCFILDLLDEGMEEMERYSPSARTAAREREEKEATEARERVSRRQKREPRENWWAKARSLSPQPTDDRVVRCQIGEATHFTSRSDCELRGGRVIRLGG